MSNMHRKLCEDWMYSSRDTLVDRQTHTHTVITILCLHYQGEGKEKNEHIHHEFTITKIYARYKIKHPISDKCYNCRPDGTLVRTLDLCLIGCGSDSYPRNFRYQPWASSSQDAVMSCGWKGNRRSGIALAMHHRIQ